MPSDDPGQCLLMGVPGTTLDTETAAFLRKIQPGGYILFGRNIESPPQLRTLIDDLRELSDVEPIVTIDQEGGRVSRLRLLGHEPPNARQLREHGNPHLIRAHGDITGRLLRLFGFNLDLCPVLDIAFDDEADNSLRGRCYGTTAEEVIEKASIFNDALRATGILSCGKHFPGYSCAGLDPHHEMPRIERSRNELETHELAVFRHFIETVDSMMIGHICISGIESDGPPASLSGTVINDLLRSEMGFHGLVMTDDLDMGAILNHFGFAETMRLGLSAGNDLLMLCHRIEMAAEARDVLEHLPPTDLPPALERIAAFKQKLAPPTAFSEEAFANIDNEIRSLRASVLGEEQADSHSPEDGKRSPVELY
jgi:beta-N-acetylhexosaminidase